MDVFFSYKIVSNSNDEFYSQIKVSGSTQKISDKKFNKHHIQLISVLSNVLGVNSENIIHVSNKEYAENVTNGSVAKF